jgi:hypothetical protein
MRYTKFNLLSVSGLIGLLLVCTYALSLWILPLSHSDLSANDPRLALILPKALREIAPPGLCEAIRYDKAPIECAGVCGTAYRLNFGTTLDQAALNAALDVPQMTRRLGAQEINLFAVGESSCRMMRMQIYFDERLK